MAEALGIAGSIVGLAAMANEIVTKGLRFCKSIIDCPEEIKTLVSETSKLRRIFYSIDAHIQKMDPNKSQEFQEYEDSLLSDCRETLASVKGIITKSGLTPGDTFKNAIKRLGWKYRKEDVMDLLSRLDRQKNNLHLALSLDGVESLQQLLVGNREIVQNVLESQRGTVQEIQKTKNLLLSGMKQIWDQQMAAKTSKEQRSKQQELGFKKIEDRQIAAQASDERRSKVLVLEMQKVADRQIATQATKEQKSKDDRRHEVLSWISLIDFREKHKEVQQTRDENTGEWFTGGSDFTAWVEKPAPAALLCTGYPGAGKTYMTCAMVNYLESKFPNGDVGIAYIYCDFTKRTSQTPELIFASILQQLAYRRPNLNSRLESVYKDCRRELRRPSLAELHSALISVSEEYNTVYIVFDALDECDEQVQRKDLLASLRQISQAPFKVLATSRPHPLDIQAAFKEAAVATIHAHNNDIKLHVENKIKEKESTGVVISSGLAATIVSQILLRSHGLFLLAKFQIDFILERPTQKDKRKAAENLTPDLQVIYGSIMTAIEERPETRGHALSILEWVGAATRPLSFLELQTAISIDDGDTKVDDEGFLDAKTMVDICGGLITIEQETQIVQFVHKTVQEYLQCRGIISDTAHYNIAKTCLTYLSFRSSRKRPVTNIPAEVKPQKDAPAIREAACFWDYAVQHWGFHMRTIREKEDLPERASNTLKSRGLLATLAQSMSRIRLPKYYRPAKGVFKTSPLHIAAQLGLIRLCQLLLGGGSLDPDLRDGHGNTPLSLAAENGHEVVVDLLVGRDDVNADSKDKNGRTPLSFAAGNGHKAVMGLLLGRADVDTNSKNESGKTPLLFAASNGHTLVVKFLAGRADVDVNFGEAGTNGWTPLAYAARRGRREMVKVLLNLSDIKANPEDSDGRTPILLAAANGHLAVVKLLAAREDVDVDSSDKLGRTPRSYAEKNGHQAVVEFLDSRTPSTPV